MTTSGTATVTLPSDTEILIVREFDAPPHLVWKAYTTPELVRRWWAGRRGEVTSCEIDLRVGGRWRYAMVATGGFEVAFHGEYREVVPDRRLVTTEVYEGAPGADPAVNVIAFRDAGAGRTTLELLVQTTSRELRDTIVESGMEAGLQEGMDILEEIAVELAGR